MHQSERCSSQRKVFEDYLRQKIYKKSAQILFNRVKIFIDFDDVLFNTKSFIADMEAVFKKHGISKDIFYETYQSDGNFSGKINSKMRSYDPSLQFKKIREKVKIDTRHLQSDFENLVKDTSKYIFEDVKNFLYKLQKKDIFLLSFGTNKFQNKKIKNSGIEKYFNKIIIVEQYEKGKAIEKIIGKSRESFCFIDDRVAFLAEVKIRYPFAKTFLVKRREGRYKDKKNKYCDFSVNNLKQILEIIKKKNGKK